MIILAALGLKQLIDQYFNPHYAVQFFPFLLMAVKYALLISVLGEFFGIIIAIFLALMKISHFKLLRAIATTYINIFRGTPLLVQLMLIYYSLPYVGINFTPVGAGILGFSLNSGAYVAEIFRAGIQSIPKGQTEAARSLGMSYFQSMVYVILPQAFKVVIPPLTNEFVALLKDSALVSVIQVQEIAATMRSLAAATYNSTSYTLAAAIYLAMTIPLTRLATYLEKKFTPVKH